jgi:hypothetical protein
MDLEAAERAGKGGSNCLGKQLYTENTQRVASAGPVLSGVLGTWGQQAKCYGLDIQGARGAQGEEKKRGYLPTYFFLRFFEIFRFDFRKYFNGVFGLLMQRNGQKRDKKKSMGRRQEKSFFSQLFSAKSF